ncbi:putative Late nodulin [Medicago truncatula]|uniref:Nodule Cysteine-Rich (NCR) secreted peptide n=1 Tax=Medicago truncatula TaxID=3880 RepID=G7IV77_MEDTR|nr:Nodule Cysteine-Rich (NCR) secreted peptide [Medicago truncatula]RHN67968.1 putative Late nodulin [Medicago truncatula]
MAKIVKFIYVMIILIFLFLVSTNIDAIRNKCFRPSDCPPSMYCDAGFQIGCVRKICTCLRILAPIDFVPT